MADHYGPTFGVEASPSESGDDHAWEGEPFQAEPDNACVVAICYICQQKYEKAKGEPRSHDVCPSCLGTSRKGTGP